MVLRQVSLLLTSRLNQQGQLYFHRSMHELFGDFFKGGLVMDGMEEVGFTEADGVPNRIEASSNFTQLPAILSFRFRVPE